MSAHLFQAELLYQGSDALVLLAVAIHSGHTQQSRIGQRLLAGLGVGGWEHSGEFGSIVLESQAGNYWETDGP